MSANLINSESVPARNLLDHFYQNRYTDVNVKSVDFCKVFPSNSTNEMSTVYMFELNGFQTGSTFDLSDIFIVNKMRLISKNQPDNIVPTDSVLSTINFPCLTCFNELTILLNDIPVIKITDYHLFVHTALYSTFCKGAKNTFLTLGGWAEDTCYYLDSFEKDSKGLFKNEGFALRRNYFGHYGDDEKFYFDEEPAELISRLFTGSSLGQIPCGVSAKIILTRTKPEIFLLADKATQEANKLNYAISDLYLLLPIVTYSDNLFADLKLKMAKEPCKLQLTQTLTSVLTIPSNITSWNNNNLNFISTPTRLAVMFVESDSYFGQFSKNPFRLGSSWAYTNQESGSLELENAKDDLDINDDDVMKNLKRPRAFNKRRRLDGKAKLSEIKEVSLLCNGNPVDGLFISGSKALDFIRFFYLNNQLDDIGPPSDVDVHSFLDHFYLLVYSLTSSLQNMAYISSPTREGAYRLCVRFDQPLAKELCLIILSEHLQTVSVDHALNVSVE